MRTELDDKIIQIKSTDNKEEINRLIEDYQPFVLNVITALKKSYVDVDNDDEFSIGLMAFYEALEKYNEARGDFLSFARLVIQSRIKDYWSQQKHEYTTNLLEDAVIEENFDEKLLLRKEIEDFEKVLKSFGLTFEQLVDHTPKHIDTQKRAKKIGLQAAEQEDLMTHLYTKKRLPITQISRRFKVSLVIVKRSKITITSVMIIVKEKFSRIMEWIE
jgi:RNA polymerase sigma factor